QVRVAEDGGADAHTDTVDRADQRLRERSERIEHPEEAVLAGVLAGLGDVLLHLDEVRARAERSTGAGDHGDRDLWVLGGGQQCPRRRVIQRLAERVKGLRPVQRQRAYAVVVGDIQHRCDLSCVTNWWSCASDQGGLSLWSR